MTAQLILVDASPRRAADGVVQAVRLAGGGALYPYRYGAADYRAGIVQLPDFFTALPFDGGDFGAGGVPQAAELQWSPSSKADLAAMANLFWIDAAITVRIGDENAAGTLPAVALSGKVLAATVDGSVLKIALCDPAADLKRPLLTARYGGTGGLDGPAEWNGKIKRRLWGRVWNLAGELIDAANSIYCWADPAQKLQGFDALRDKGAPAATLTTVAWQGTQAATLAALQAAAAPQGGGITCPSIACVKWWTQPAGDLTADVRGEIGSGYVERTADITARIVAAGPNTAFAAGTVAAASALRTAPVGWVAKDENTSVAAMLEDLLGHSSLLWLLDATGAIVIRDWAWGASAASAISQSVKRTDVFRPVATRKIGYARNETPIARGNLAAIVLASEIAMPGPGVNRVPFSQFESTAAAAWFVSAVSGVSGAALAFSTILGIPTVTLSGTAAAAGSFTSVKSAWFPVTAGEVLACQVRLSTNAISTFSHTLQYMNAAGALIAAQPLVVNFAGITTPSQYQFQGLTTVPASAVSARIETFLSATAAGAVSGTLSQPIVSGAESGQLVFPAFSAGPNAFPAADVTATNVSASITGQGALATKNAVNLSTADAGVFGSIPLSVPSGGFTYTSTTTTITISWAAFTIYRADLSTVAVSAGSQAITGLSAAKTYRVYPYMVDSGGAAGTVDFVTGASAGAPAIAHPSVGSALAAATMNQRGNVPLGQFSVATPGSGSGGGSGGGFNCLHPDMMLGGARADTLRVGDIVPTPGGMAPIRRIMRALCSEWFVLFSGDAEIARVTGDHLLYLATGEGVRARNVRIGILLRTREDHCEVTGIHLDRSPSMCVGIDVGEPHLHFGGPVNLLMHNGTAKP